MKHLKVLFFSMVLASSALAGEADIKAVTAMTNAGATTLIMNDQGIVDENGNQAVTVITNVICSNSAHDACRFKAAIEADVDTKTVVTEDFNLVGTTLSAELTDALIGIGVPSYQVRTGVAVRVNMVRCVQPFKGQARPTAAETTCTVTK